MPRSKSREKSIPPESIETVIHCLDDKSSGRRSEAALELEAFGRAATIPFFNAWSDLSDRQRLDGIEILSRTPYAVTARRALQQFRREPDARFRAALVTLVGRTGGNGHIPELARSLKDPDKRVRANAVEAISELGGREVINLLLPLLDDPSNRVKANTAKALWEFDELRGHIRKVFEEMVHDHSKWMKASAFYAFGEVGIMEFFNLLMDSLDEDDEDIARNAVLALIGYAEKYDPDRGKGRKTVKKPGGRSAI